VSAGVRSAARAFRPPIRLWFPKSEGESCEDACAVARRAGIAAVSDGASVSFDSRAWARILVRRYAQRPEFDAAWLRAAIADFAGLHDRDALPWMHQAAFDRGSFASLLGVTDLGDGHIRVLAIGDSIAVLGDGDRIVASFPYTAAEQFDQRPRLLSTNSAENAFLDDIEPEELAITWNIRDCDSPCLLCVTDALGHWLLSHRYERPSPIATLRQIGSPAGFKRFVLGERGLGRLRRDDTTLLAYWQRAEP
jgi:hypothetical protein